MYRGWLIALLGLATVAAACGDNPAIPDTPNTAGGIAGLVTAEVASQLDENGLLPLSDGATGEMSRATAVALANAYVRSAGRWIGSVWEADRGGLIDVPALIPCGRTYYAASSMHLDETASPSLKRSLGPRWLVQFCEGGGPPVVSVSVAALATDLSIRNGRLIGPGGNDFISSGIPVGATELPISPERAIQAVAAASGERIAAVPELVLAPPPLAPQLARWRLRLEAPVSLRGSIAGGATDTDMVFFGYGSTWRTMALQINSRSEDAREVFDPQRGPSVRTTAFVVVPSSFEPATVVKP